MFGDSFFTIMKKNARFEGYMVFSSPCLGILFSQAGYKILMHVHDEVMFSSPCLGILFSHVFTVYNDDGDVMKFSSPCLGILFSQISSVPLSWEKRSRFRPHVWGFFFHSRPGVPHGMGSLWPFCGGDFQLIGILIIFTL